MWKKKFLKQINQPALCELLQSRHDPAPKNLESFLLQMLMAKLKSLKSGTCTGKELCKLL